MRGAPVRVAAAGQPLAEQGLEEVMESLPRLALPVRILPPWKQALRMVLEAVVLLL